MGKSGKTVQKTWVSNEGMGFVTVGIFLLVNAAHGVRHTPVMDRTSSFLPSHFLVFLRGVSLVLLFLLFRFYLFTLSCVASEQPQASHHQRFGHVQWVSVTISALCSSSWLCCAMHWLIRENTCCVSTHQNQVKVVLPSTVSLCQYHISYLDVLVTRFFFLCNIFIIRFTGFTW